MLTLRQQVSDLIARNHLPAQLRVFLADPRVKKVGRLVNGDLKRLEKSFHSPIPFSGGLDLGKLAKDRCILDSIQSITLADLSAIFLRKRLNKTVPERLSDLWGESSLTERQIKYAAADAFASLELYHEITRFTVPKPFPSSSLPSPATPVLLYAGDKSKIVAVGQVSIHSLASTFDRIKLSPSSTVIDVFHIITPGAKLPAHRNKSLRDFGHTPFSAIVPKSLLRTYVLPENSASSPYNLPGSEYYRTPSNTHQHTSSNQPAPTPASDSTPAPHQDTVVDGGPIAEDESPSSESESLANIIFDSAGNDPQIVVDDSGIPFTPQSIHTERDANVSQRGAEIMGPPPIEWNQTIRSRVLKDIFHVFNLFYISAKHGLRVEFCRALAEALLIPDRADWNRLAAYGASLNPPLTVEQLVLLRWKWVWKHCKRVIPPPEILYPRVRAVFELFGPLKDATTGKALFGDENDSNWKVAKNILDLIYNGYVSDPPGVALYSTQGIDEKSNLPVYHCFRGTGRTEGGWHTHLRPHLPTSGASVRHAQAAIDDYSLAHNLDVCGYLFCRESCVM